MLTEQMQIFFRLADETLHWVKSEELTLEDLKEASYLETASIDLVDHIYLIKIAYFEEESKFLLQAIIESRYVDEEYLIMAEVFTLYEDSLNLESLITAFKDEVENKNRARYGFAPIERRK